MNLSNLSFVCVHKTLFERATATDFNKINFRNSVSDL